MGLDPNHPAQPSGTAPPIDPSFVPTCPGCNYDLRGIPDGVCPECGAAFTVAKLYADAEIDRMRRGLRVAVSPDWLLLVMAAPSLLCSPILSSGHRDDQQVREVWLLVLWMTTIVWAVRRLDLGFGRGSWRLGWLSFPAAWTLLVLFGSGGRANAPEGFAAAAMALLAGLAWACVRAGRAWLLPMISGGVFAAIGTLMLSVVAEDRAADRVWSRLADPRPGQVFAQYPLRVDEAFWLTGSMIGAGLLLGLLGVVMYARRRRP